MVINNKMPVKFYFVHLIVIYYYPYEKLKIKKIMYSFVYCPFLQFLVYAIITTCITRPVVKSYKVKHEEYYIDVL